jgi:hypothetical protein
MLHCPANDESLRELFRIRRSRRAEFTRADFQDATKDT